MATVTAQVIGGSIKQFTASNVEDLRKQMELAENYSASVNGEPQGQDYNLSDYEFITFAQQVKGA